MTTGANGQTVLTLPPKMMLTLKDDGKVVIDKDSGIDAGNTRLLVLQQVT
ncbi:hypothetical protein [Acinetobacter baylyi]|nr:hypothetical protein [Acinetobacter baylyi]UXJ62055.1 hypothetical protein N5P13_07565 [Acinetobacter baylyi]